MTSQIVLIYILKTIAISGIFVAYYWLALRDKKFHYYNRFYLLLTSSLSLVIPFFNFNWFNVEAPIIYRSSEMMQFVIPVAYNVPASVQYDWKDYGLLVASTITIVLLFLLVRHIVKIHLLKQHCEIVKMDGFDFVNTNDESAPFSFLNNLFWKKSISLQDEGGKQIFKHEITHIQQKHTWDRIYCQIVASLFWMNPFNWIIQKELVAIHEFIADEVAIGNSNVEAFAKMLLQTHYGNHFLKPIHSFFYSSIKRRLSMLTKSTNTKYTYLRRVMVLPVIICSVCIVSIKVHAREKIETKLTAIKNNITSMLIDTTKPVSNKKVHILPPSPPASQTPQSPSSLNVVSSVVYPNGAPKPTIMPVFYLDGVKIEKSAIDKIPATDIKSINVFKGDQAIKLYPIDGQNGVIDIRTKANYNLQNKISDETIIVYSNKEVKEKDPSIVVFNPPKIQKDLDASKNNDPIFYTAEKPAQFPGGSQGWINYLSANFNRDLMVQNGAPVGKYRVVLSFVVTSDGDVKDVVALNNPGYGSASEAIRFIEKGPKWIPAEQNGKKVNFFISQAIAFSVTAD